MPADRLISAVLQRYWRLSRGVTLGAQGVVLTHDDRVLLVRHTYRPGWHFPGGGVEIGETALAALGRELSEEAGIEITEPPQLFGLYANFRLFPGDHIALYVVRSWRQPHVPRPNREIAEQRFFSLAELEHSTSRPTRDRLAEILEGAPRSADWSR